MSQVKTGGSFRKVQGTRKEAQWALQGYDIVKYLYTCKACTMKTEGIATEKEFYASTHLTRSAKAGAEG